MKLIDLTGRHFGELIVLERDYQTQEQKKSPKPYWKCRCSCGNVFSVLGKSLREGRTVSCGCMAKERAKKIRFEDITNQKFGKLVVKKYVGNSHWMCQCECGHITSVSTGHLKSGHTTSCGCVRSKGELIIAQLLQKNNISFIKEYTNDLLVNSNGNKIRIDFAILNDKQQIKYFIEYNGKQHYDTNDPWYKDIVEDGQKIKENFAKKQNIPFLVIKYDEDIEEFIMSNVDFSEIRE